MSDICVYTVQDVAEILKVSTKTVYKLLKEGDLKSIKVRGQFRVPSSALDNYLKGGSTHD